MSRNTATAVRHEADFETERNGYNRAFCELGLEWFWDARTYSELLEASRGACRVRAYLERDRPHLLKAYDAEFLARAIDLVRSRCSAPH